MKALIWFCKEFKIGNVINSNKIKEINQKNITSKEIYKKNVIVPWITVEGKKDINYFNNFLKDVLFLKERFKTDKVVLVPFAHLTEKIASRDISFSILLKLKDFLEENNFKVDMAHFGSSKDVLINCPADQYQIIFRSYPLSNFKKDFKLNNYL
jgi:hypothetical protein